MPYSPNETVVPPLALPCSEPRWVLRCRTFLGINMSIVPWTEVGGLVVLARGALDLLLLGEKAFELGIRLLDEGLVLLGHLGVGRRRGGLLGLAPGRRRHHLAGPRFAGGVADGHGGLLADLVLELALVGEDVALVDPDLHADAAVGRARLTEAVVDVGSQRVQRDPALAVPLGAGHLGTTQAAGALHPDALGAGLGGVLHGALHGPAERDAAGELVGDALGDQRGV